MKHLQKFNTFLLESVSPEQFYRDNIIGEGSSYGRYTNNAWRQIFLFLVKEGFTLDGARRVMMSPHLKFAASNVPNASFRHFIKYYKRDGIKNEMLDIASNVTKVNEFLNIFGKEKSSLSTSHFWFKSEKDKLEKMGFTYEPRSKDESKSGLMGIFKMGDIVITKQAKGVVRGYEDYDFEIAKNGKVEKTVETFDEISSVVNKLNAKKDTYKYKYPSFIHRT